MNVSAWTEHRRISILYLGAILVFGVLSLLSVGAARLEHLYPSTRIMAPFMFGQLLGLHNVLLHFFVLVPAIPAVLGYAMMPSLTGTNEVAFPRLALASWVLFVLGGIHVCWSFLWGGLEPGWMYAVVSPLTRGAVSSAFLVGLFLACLSMQITGLVLIVTIRRSPLRTQSLFSWGLASASWLMVLALPLLLSALALALLVKHTPFALFDMHLGEDSTFLAVLCALVSTPMKAIVWLSALGAACAVFQPERFLAAASVRRLGWFMVAIAAFSVVAIDPIMLPPTVHAAILFVGAFNTAILVALLYGITIPLLGCAVRQAGVDFAARLYASAALFLIVVFAPLELFLRLPATAGFATGYLGMVSHHLLFAGCGLLMLLGGIHHFLEAEGGMVPNKTLTSCFGVVLLAGLVTTFLPMILMGTSGLSPELAMYPPQYTVLQVLAVAGGTILAVGIFCAISLLLAGFRHRPLVSY